MATPKQQIPKNPIYTQQSPATPIHLYGSVVLRSGSNGSVPPAAMKNPMGQDMELLEIKFEVSGASPGAEPRVFGGTIWCELIMGSYKLTNGSIPVWNFGRAENILGEVKFDALNQTAHYAYSWRLPRPLFIPAGAVVTPNFTHTGFVQETLNVMVGYSARTVFTKPKRIYMPWVAKYASKVFNPITDADTDISTELDLVNPNSEVLHLQRFVGRTQRLSTLQASSETSQPVPSQFLQVRITDSYGRPVLRNYAPFRSVFGSLTRSWELDNGAILDPESYYIVNLRKDAMSIVSPLLENDSTQAFVSMVGWRELEKL